MRRTAATHIAALLLTLAGMMPAGAQTATEVRNLYNAARYAEAKPGVEKLLKAAPNNANYNLWMGVCCMETGEGRRAVTYLDKAVKRKADGAPMRLADAYRRLSLYEDAVATLETHVADLKKRRKPTAEADALLEQCRTGLRMIRGVEQVVVVDSVVVDKRRFLEAYRITPDAGSLHDAAGFFGAAADSVAATAFLNEWGDQVLYAALRPDSTYALMMSRGQDGAWDEPTPLPDNINTPGGNANYPYMMPDGVTIYYAATGKGSMGGYDIFVTRYDSEDNTYFTPDNVGMPFNSEANDYMYVVDEFSGLGWFATDRNQPDDKVCVYVFVPNDTKRVYSYESMGKERMAALARIDRMADTWGGGQDAEQARQRLQALAAPHAEGDGAGRDFVFVVNDQKTCYRLADFASPRAREAFVRWQQQDRRYRELTKRIAAMREQYAGGNSARRSGLTPTLLELERQERQLYGELRQAEADVRRLELNREP